MFRIFFKIFIPFYISTFFITTAYYYTIFGVPLVVQYYSFKNHCSDGRKAFNI
jgi:hypothetical protein